MNLGKDITREFMRNPRRNVQEWSESDACKEYLIERDINLKGAMSVGGTMAMVLIIIFHRMIGITGQIHITKNKEPITTSAQGMVETIQCHTITKS